MKGLTRWRSAKPTEVNVWRPRVAWGPFAEMEEEMSTLLDRMDRVFGHWPVQAVPARAESVAWSPSVDVTEDEKEYLIKAELPEVKKEEIKVLVRDGTLSISGERRAEKEEKGKTYHRIERAYGAFDRGFNLPRDADATKIECEFKDGVLNIHLPKAPDLKPTPVEIQVK